MFWDASALVPLLVEEARSDTLRSLYDHDDKMTVWWGSAVECASAIARLEREERLTVVGVRQALEKLDRLRGTWNEFHPSEELRATAIRFVRVHPLRAADALQLASAFLVAEGRPSTLEFVSLDDKLCEAARREGFPLPLLPGS